MRKLINKELIRFEEVLETLINYRNDDCPDYQCLLDMIKSVDMAKTELLLRLNERDELEKALQAERYDCAIKYAEVYGAELKINELEKKLASAQKAVEFVNAIIKHRNNGVDLEKDGIIYNLIDEYEQKESKQ